MAAGVGNWNETAIGLIERFGVAWVGTIVGADLFKHTSGDAYRFELRSRGTIRAPAGETTA